MNTLAHLLPTINSLEISELVEKRHDNVRRTIETLAAQDVIRLPQIEGIPTTTKSAVVYVFSGEQGKRDSVIVVARLSPEFTARLVDRWQELEARQAPVIPQTLPEALRLAADLAEQRAQAVAALAIAAPKAKALDRISANSDSLTFTQAAKVLGVKCGDLTAWLHAHKWIYRQNGSWVAYQQHIHNGRLLYKEASYTDDDSGQRVYRPYCHLTTKGLTWLAEYFADDSSSPLVCDGGAS